MKLSVAIFVLFGCVGLIHCIELNNEYTCSMLATCNNKPSEVDVVTLKSFARSELLQIVENIPKEVYCLMGMKSRIIPDSKIQASSTLISETDPNPHAAKFGRLDQQSLGSQSGPVSAGCWAAGKNDLHQWIEVDLGSRKLVGGVVTQGRPISDHMLEWVKSFKVEYGLVPNLLMTIQEEGKDKIFTANSDVDTKVMNKFPTTVEARYIRIKPQSWNSHISMRMDLVKGDEFCNSFP